MRTELIRTPEEYDSLNDEIIKLHTRLVRDIE